MCVSPESKVRTCCWPSFVVSLPCSSIHVHRMWHAGGHSTAAGSSAELRVLHSASCSCSSLCASQEEACAVLSGCQRDFKTAAAELQQPAAQFTPDLQKASQENLNVSGCKVKRRTWKASWKKQQPPSPSCLAGYLAKTQAPCSFFVQLGCIRL